MSTKKKVQNFHVAFRWLGSVVCVQVYLNGTIDLGGCDIASLVEGAADPLNNVHKDLIAAATIGALCVQH